MSQYTTHISLLNRLSSDDNGEAWSEFHDRYGLLIRRMAERQGLQAADCDEVVQDVLTALAKAIPSFEYDPSKGMFRAYLKTVTQRKISDRWRRRSSEVNVAPEQLESAFSDPTTDEAWETEWRQYHLRQAMVVIESEFNQVDRAAFEAYAVRGDAAAATADSLGISIDHVYQAKSRILRRLGEIIEHQVSDEG